MALDLGTLTGFLALDDGPFAGVVDKLPDRLQGMSAGLGLAATAVAAGVGIALAKGLENAIELDGVEATLSAQLGLTADESARLGAVAGSLYADAYGESVTEVSAAVETVVSSIRGMREASDAEVEAMTAKVLNISTAFEIDAGRIAQVTGQLLTTGLASSAEEGADLVAAAMQRVPKNVREDILDAADEYGPFFAQLGYDGEQAFGALVASAEQGMYGIDKTGDALKELTIRATDMSTASVEAYEAAGLNAEEMANKILAGGDSAREGTKQIVDGLLGIDDPAARANAAIALFGTPLEDLGVDKIPGFLQSVSDLGAGLGDVTGTADAMGEALGGTVASRWEGMSRQFDALLGQVGGALLPILEQLLGWVEDNPEAMTAMAIAVGVAAVAFGVLAAALWVASLTPITLIIGAIVLGIAALVAAVVWLVTSWDEIWPAIEQGWSDFVGWITAGIDGFVGWWNGVWGGIGAAIETGWLAVVAWFESLPQALLDLLAGAGEWLLDVGRMILEGLATGLVLGFLAIHYLFTQFPTDLWTWMGEAGVWLLETGNRLLVGLGLGIIAGWQAVAAWFQSLPDLVHDFLVDIAIWLLTDGRALLDGFLGGIRDGWNGTVAWFQALPRNIANFLVGAAVWLVSSGRDVLSGLLTGITGFWGSIVSFFQNLPANIAGFFVGVGSWLYSAGRDLVNGLLEGVRSLASSVGSFFLDLLPDWIIGPFKTALGIASPSKVFAEFGRNIADGVIVGVGQREGALGDRMATMVQMPDVPTSSYWGAIYPGMGGGVTVDARMYVDRAGWTREELEQERNERLTDSLSMAGLDGISVD